MALVPDRFNFDPKARQELMATLNGKVKSPGRVIDELEEVVYLEIVAPQPDERGALEVLSDLYAAIADLREAVLALGQNERASDLVRIARIRLREIEPFVPEALATLGRWDSIFSAYAGGPDPRAQPATTDAPEPIFDAGTPAGLWQAVVARGQASILDQAKPKKGRPRLVRRDRVAHLAAKVLEHHGVVRPHHEDGVLVQVLPCVLEAVDEQMPDDVRKLLAHVNARDD
jgi:hypothetical protein